ncbi:RNA-binding S4 domain-containing protein [Porphyromonas catoniae]|jgi:putative heat shock protein 15|uniref:S4 domain protein n=2 Tax=Porphyromonas catoniae TaxID=41976 RepID=Z4WRP3_9PORP|nr:RNA-binding S4 domain-containing protein [Porphyromonas catoniae]EKY01284.1 S4 domain protein [Porphyromonas catoniae F0037]EWC91943.1 S4 domain protein [Porphyromonas catoniae ATCC 51270]
MEEARVDKWLWAVRIFKTRSIATDACKKGRVAVGGTVVKPSRMIHVGDIVSVRKPPIEYSFRVIQLLGSRVGAKRVEEFMQNVTPREQYELLELQRVSGFVDRAKGLGRPTKKDRRDLDQFAEELPEGIEIFDWDEEWD